MKLVEGGEVSRAIGEEKNARFKNLPFTEGSNVVIPEYFPPKLKHTSRFCIPCMVGPMRIGKALCELGTSVSLMPYPIFQKLASGGLQPTPISL